MLESYVIIEKRNNNLYIINNNKYSKITNYYTKALYNNLYNYYNYIKYESTEVFNELNSMIHKIIYNNNSNIKIFI